MEAKREEPMGWVVVNITSHMKLGPGVTRIRYERRTMVGWAMAEVLKVLRPGLR